MKNLTNVMTGAVLALALAACSSGAASDPGATPAAARGSAPTGSSTVERAGEAGDAARPITITAGDRTFSAVLNDSDAARDFAESLPVTIPASRVGGIEYMVELPAPLTETGPFYRTVEAGDIVYWNPRNSVTVIYAPTSPGLGAHEAGHGHLRPERLQGTAGHRRSALRSRVGAGRPTTSSPPPP